MKNKKVTAIAAGTLAAISIGAGTWAGLRYWMGDDFTPSASERALRKNQVLFQQEPDPQATADRDDGEDGARWEKDQNAQQPDSPQLDQNSNFLFQTDNGQTPDATTGGILDENTRQDPLQPADNQPSGQPGQLPDQIFTPVDDNKENTDGTGGGTGSGTILPGTDGTDETEPEEPAAPTEPTEPVKKPPYVPKGDPSDKPSTGSGYVEEPGENGEEMHMTVEPKTDRLYVGQELDDFGIFCRMDVQFSKMGNDWPEFWDLDQSHYGTYFRINAISFDGGKTWITDFPVTVPEGASDIHIRMEYRFTQSGSWQKEELEYGAAEEGVLYVLSQLPEEGDERLDTSIILNYDTLGGCNPKPGTSFNLLELLSNQILVEGSGNTNLSSLNYLFLGWQEDGENVPWMYPMTSGRHVLLPAGYVPTPEGWQVSCNFFWVNPDGYYRDDDASVLWYLQTAVGVPAAENGVLTVPQYIQAVDLDAVDTDELHLSDTVLMVAGNSGNVHTSFTVDEENPQFSSCTAGPLAGLLLSKDRTAIYAIPGGCESLTLPDTVKNVYSVTGGIVRNLTVEATQTEKLPNIDESLLTGLEQLTAANTETLAALLAAHLDTIEEVSDLKLSCRELPNVRFWIQEDGLTGDNGIVYRLLREEAAVYTVPMGVKTLAAEACLGRENLQTLVLPVDGEILHLGKDSLRGTGLKTIYYSSEAQKLALQQELAQSGAPEDAQLLPLRQTREGFTYMPLENGTVKLLRGPAGLVEYTGGATAEDGTALTVSTIGSGCFAGNTQLQWVTLPESVAELEQNAFQNCTALQGILMEATEAVTLEQDCFNGCTALRFCAINSNNVTASKIFSSSAAIPTRIWCLDPGVGLPKPWGVVSNSSGFTMVPVGNTGRLLYALGYNGEKAILVSTSAVLPENVELDAGITQIATDAFRNVKGENGGFTINWADLWDLNFIGEDAFRDAQLTGDLDLTNCNSMSLSSRAFSGTLISSFQAGDWTYLSFGTEVFWSCPRLKEATIGYVSDTDSMSYLLFGDCESMEVLRFTNSFATPPKLLLYASKQATPFYFGPENNKNFHIEVPEGRASDYIRSWRFQMAGYTDYESMKERLNCLSTGTNAKLEKELLDGINRLRKLLGLETEQTLTDFYPYTVDDSGKTTLRGAPAGIESASLSAAQLGMKSGMTLDYIGTNAFSGCTALTELTLEENLPGIYPKAFAGSGLQTLIFNTISAPQLLCGEGEPFDFGVENLRVVVPAGGENTFLMAWRCPMLGYADEDALRAALAQESEEDLDARVEKALLRGENLVRDLLGLDHTESVTDDFRFEQDGYSLTLVGVPKNLEELDLGALSDALIAENLYLNRIGAGAFRNAANLRTVTVPDTMFWPPEFAKNAFAGTNGVTLVLGSQVPTLCVDDDGESYSFGGSSLTVETDSAQTLLDSWKYPFAGYTSQYSFSDALFDENDFNNSRAAMAAALLVGENGARAALGMAQVSEPSGFHYVSLDDTLLTLDKAAWDTTVMYLDPYILGMPDGWYLDYIGTGAFAECKMLTEVVIPDNLSAIHSDAFAQDTLTLTFLGETPPSLFTGYNGEFHWGVNNLVINVPVGTEENYLDIWKYQMSGAYDMDSLLSKLWMEHWDWTDDQLNAEAERMVAANEALLREAMGMAAPRTDDDAFELELVRDGVKLTGAPSGLETAVLDAETLGTDEDMKLLEIDADAFQNCNLLTRLEIPDTVDAISSKAFTSATDSLTLVFQPRRDGVQPPKLVLWENKTQSDIHPFSFGLTKAYANVNIIVTDEEERKAYIEAWTAAFAGGESEADLIARLTALYTDTVDETTGEPLTAEQIQEKAESEAAARLAQARAALEQMISYPKPVDETNPENGETKMP